MMRLLRDARGLGAVEFALVAPALLMFIFLILDGSRMLFVKQAINQAAMATARCTALKAANCTTQTAAESYGVAYAVKRGGGMVSDVQVDVMPSTTCNSVTNMARATVRITSYKRGAMNLLPQSMTPSTLSSSYCFPLASAT